MQYSAWFLGRYLRSIENFTTSKHHYNAAVDDIQKARITTNSEEINQK
jgi:hypothetical protein